MSVAPAHRLEAVSEYYFSRKLDEIRKLVAAGEKVIALGIGSPDLAAPTPAIEAATQKLHEPGAHGYASYRSTPELRAAISRWYEPRSGVRLDPETQILPLLGSKEGIFSLSAAFLNPGDQVLVPDPGYPAYSAVARLLDAEPRFYALTRENAWLPDLAALEKSDLSRVKLMWVNYPHMPSGATASAEFFVRLAAFAKKHRILVCQDAAYAGIGGRAPALLAAPGALENCVELHSLSKAYWMAGWRVGILLGAREHVEPVLKFKSNVDSGIFLAVQAGAISALGTGAEWAEPRDRVLAERRVAGEKLARALGFTVDPGQVGIFVWARAPESVRDVGAFVDEVLAKHRIFVVPGSVFGTQGSRYLRISLCAEASVIREAVRRVGGNA